MEYFFNYFTVGVFFNLLSIFNRTEQNTSTDFTTVQTGNKEAKKETERTRTEGDEVKKKGRREERQK